MRVVAEEVVEKKEVDEEEVRRMRWRGR